jgi:hypothetical protein
VKICYTEKNLSNWPWKSGIFEKTSWRCPPRSQYDERTNSTNANAQNVPELIKKTEHTRIQSVFYDCPALFDVFELTTQMTSAGSDIFRVNPIFGWHGLKIWSWNEKINILMVLMVKCIILSSCQQYKIHYSAVNQKNTEHLVKQYVFQESSQSQHFIPKFKIST